MKDLYQDIIEKDSKYVFQNYTRQPIAITSGQGALVRDSQGKDYIDCVAGIAVNNIGHCHPAVVEAVSRQVSELIHVSNLYYTRQQSELAARLVPRTGMDRVFFCNSGTEAVEGALKLARRATGRTDFVAAEHSFHGRTMGALSVTHKPQFREPFQPLIQKVEFVPYSDLEALKGAVDTDTAALILEPIQGEGGIHVPDDGYLQTARDICEDAGVLLIFDEVQTGMGRTGKWFAREHSGVVPDIMTMAKAMAGGLPMGALLAMDETASKMQKGDHAATFGGGPLLCAAALASLKVIEDEGLVDRSARMGRYLVDKLEGLELEAVREIRGKGLMVGMELAVKCGPVVDYTRENGVLLNCTSDSVLRFVPPLVITQEQIDKVTDVVAQGIERAK
ncbi:MAG: acetylornithine transaminase [Methanosarcinales archaeon]|nr:acetylornithine transaminase [Methanosarcinales archaeon]